MQAMRSSTALVELVDSVGSQEKGDSGTHAAHKYVSLRLDLGIVEEVPVRGSRADAAWVRPVLEAPAVERYSLSQPADERSLAGEAWRRAHASDPVTAGRSRGCGAMGVAEGAGLAHDAGNLLSALGLYSELLAMPGVLHEEFREYAEELRLLSERSSAMIARLFDRAHELKAEESYKLTSLPEVIARLRGLLNRIAGRRVEVSFGRGSDRPVNVSPEVVERMVINLVKNSAEAMGDEAGGSISVHVAASGAGRDARVVLTVEDDGCGMTRSELASLGTCGDPKQGRRGLGLRVVRELAALSDGWIAMASAPGEGTRISIEWQAIEEVEIEVREGTRRVLRGEAGWIAC